MGGAATDLGDEAQHLGRIKLCCVGRGEIVGDHDARLGEVAHSGPLRLAHEIAERFPQTKATVGYPENFTDKIDLVLNATSLGLRPDDALPIDESQFSLANAPAVFDIRASNPIQEGIVHVPPLLLPQSVPLHEVGLEVEGLVEDTHSDASSQEELKSPSIAHPGPVRHT